MTRDCGCGGQNAKAKGASLDGGFVAEAFSDALRVHVGRGKPWSVEALAAATALDFATVKGYHAGANGPSLAKFLTIAAVLPDEFINRVLALAGFGGAARLEPDAVSALTVNRQISDLMAQFAAALEDGRIDHRERAELVASARALLPMIQDFVATHGGEK